MKIVALSDTHCQLSQVDVPDGDILVHCGDFTYFGEQKELIQFGKHLRKLPHKHKILVPGNHDLRLDVFHEKYHPDAVKWINPDANTHILINEIVTIEGITFFGSPMVPKISQWAFGRNPLTKDMIYQDIIHQIDSGWIQKPHVVISHAPPSGILDEVDYGCPVLLDFITTLKPKLHLFGHCHEGYGHTKNEHTTFINVSTCNREYLPKNKPYIIEVEGI